MRIVVLVAASAAALGLLGSAQGGSFPGSNGLIGLTCGSSVCTATADGTVYGSPLISSATNPAWSADGTKLAFVKTGDVWTANADGTSQSPFVTGAGEPTWAPNGTTIAYVKSDNHIYARTGGAETQLTSTGTDTDPAYSPSGTKLAYSSIPSGGSSYDLYVLTIGGSATAIVTTGADDVSPSWSPDGSTIVYSSGGSLYTVPAAGGTPTPLGISGLDPAFSPDGTLISYASLAGTLSVANADGTNAHAINTFLAASQIDWGKAAPPSSGSGGTTGSGPTNSSYPTVNLAAGDSSPVVGHTLTASVGTWSGTFPISYTYRWKRCDPVDPVNGPCVDIPGATSSSYTPTAADYGKRLRVAVIAKNTGGSTLQNSEVTAPVDAIAPKNTATPPVTPGGSPVVDATLTVAGGTWQGSTPIAFTYSWRRCNPVGDIGTCVPIVGATSSTYVPTVADIGLSLRVWVTGSNVVGSDVVITNHTFPVVDKPHFAPSVAVPPAIAGTALPGRQLTATIGTFKGDAPIATSFHWYRCDATGVDCHAVAGATKVVYRPSAADIGYTLRLFVFASNAYGKLLAQSDPTVSIAATPPHVRGRRIVGTPRGDYLAGGGHDDVIIGNAGNDTLLGGAGDDRLDGGKGNDVITGGSGADTISGGPGSDWVDAADGERDVIDCGTGNDHAVVDVFDVVRNCEVVDKR